MERLPLYLRVGFFLMGIDPYAEPADPPVDEEYEDPLQDDEPTTQTAGHWIPITQERPEQYKLIIIHTVDNEVLYEWARVTEDQYIHRTENSTLTQNQITHWMYPGQPQM